MEHPIGSLMQTAMENLKDMVDVNTIVGQPVETPDGSVILPISRVGFGFAAGGSEFRVGESHTAANNGPAAESPFGGGAGGGVSINPMGFLVVGHGTVKLLSAEPGNQIYDKLIDLAPAVMDKIEAMMGGNRAPAGAAPAAAAMQEQAPNTYM
jgi:sporulation protein YtfJ